MVGLPAGSVTEIKSGQNNRVVDSTIVKQDGMLDAKVTEYEREALVF